MKNYAIILGAGSGNRFGSFKQVEKINKKPVYLYSLDVFINTGLFSSIFLVVPKKLIKLINLNSSDVSYYDCRCQTIVVSKQHETYIRLMPKIKLEDLSKKLISPMPGLIKSVDVSEGQKVKSGDQLLIIEAMKMENILKSEKDCVIDKVLIKPGDSVGADEELILFSK